MNNSRTDDYVWTVCVTHCYKKIDVQYLMKSCLEKLFSSTCGLMKFVNRLRVRSRSFTWKKVFTMKIGIKKCFDPETASGMPLFAGEI